MTSSQNLQALTVDSADRVISHHSSNDFSILSLLGMALVFLFFFYMLYDGRGNYYTDASSSTGNQKKKGVTLDATEKKYAEQVRSIEMGLKNLALKKREAEAEIRKIEMNSMTNVDIEASYENELKIDKLRMKIEEIEIMEQKKTEELDGARIKLEEYQNQDLL